MSLAHAKALRKQMTDAERRVWYLLRAHRFAECKFKRQAPIGPYIVDFVCFSRRLVLEVDGGQHADSTDDVRRDAWLKREGFRMLRFWNNDVLKNTNGVLEMILSALEAYPSPGSLRSPPSPPKRAFTPVFDGLWGEGTPSVRRHP